MYTCKFLDRGGDYDSSLETIIKDKNDDYTIIKSKKKRIN